MRRFLWITPIFAAACGLAGCAARSAAVRPQPFPGAVPSVRPADAAPEEPATPPPPSARSDLIRLALSLRGTPYRNGGDSPESGFDCSGFVRYVFGRERIDLPRTVADQFAMGLPESLSDVREGDLVFFTTGSPGPSHVALALGNGEFIHAPSGSGVVRVERLDSAYWHNRVIAVKRLF
jgi:cell wall-associated NlpC family hydrolase